MTITWSNSTGWPSFTHISLTTPSDGEGMWFIVFIASTIIRVSPFFIFFPISINFFPPGSGARYAVPIIGEVTLLPDETSLSLLFSFEETSTLGIFSIEATEVAALETLTL